MMMSSDHDLLSARISAVWIAALCFVLILHCIHVARLRGEHRWYHSTHVVMLLGMLSMYAAVAFGLDWLPERVWMIIYVATSAAIILWMLIRVAFRRAFGDLWMLALVQQVTMIYMWAPMKYWVPQLSYALAAYFALEMLAWLTRAWVKPAPGGAFALAGGPASVPLVDRPVFNDVCMSIMAASMGYMFAGMQLMMAMPRQGPQVAQQQQSQGGVSNTAGEEKRAAPPPLPAPQAAMSEPAKQAAARTSPSAPGESYTVAAGDTLGRIAAGLYGDVRKWHSIINANPDLDPRRLHIGQVIKLPMPPLPHSRSR